MHDESRTVRSARRRIAAAPPVGPAAYREGPARPRHDRTGAGGGRTLRVFNGVMVVVYAGLFATHFAGWHSVRNALWMAGFSAVLAGLLACGLLWLASRR